MENLMKIQKIGKTFPTPSRVSGPLINRTKYVQMICYIFFDEQCRGERLQKQTNKNKKQKQNKNKNVKKTFTKNVEKVPSYTCLYQLIG